PSFLINAVYCFNKALEGSFKILSKSFTDNLSNSTRIGNLPCNSGIKSDGFDMWNAPAAINNIGSGLTEPCVVEIVEPSTIGKICICTPSRAQIEHYCP